MPPGRPVPPVPPQEGGPVPVFGSWPRIYAAVLLVELATLALIALFSSYPY